MLHRLVGEVRPCTVIGPAFEGGHADHDATSFAIAEGCRRAGWHAPIFEYPCYAPDTDASKGLRLGAFPAHSAGVQYVDLDQAATRCKELMAEVYASQKDVFELLGGDCSAGTFSGMSLRSRSSASPCAGLDSYAHWFNWRSPDRFEQLAAAVASATSSGSRNRAPRGNESGEIHAGANKSWSYNDRGNEMEDFHRLQRLCKLETGQQPESPTDPAYAAWMSTKRPFSPRRGGRLLHAQAGRAVRRLPRPIQR